MTPFRELWHKIKAMPDGSTLKHRLQRAGSWCERGCAEEEHVDARCIFLWIAFNAAYSSGNKADRAASEQQQYKLYFADLLPLDADRRIDGLITTDLRSRIYDLVGNMYVFRGFWDSLTDQPFDMCEWPKRGAFQGDRTRVGRLLGYSAPKGALHARRNATVILSDTETSEILRILFDRLYVLRNQLMHGCATRDGSLNRRQVEDGATILASLVPAFLAIMIANPHHEWGPVPFPVRDDIREDKNSQYKE